MGVLGRVQSGTLVRIAAGTFLVGGFGLYLAQKQVQKRVRNLPHYKEAFSVMMEHEGALRIFGPPILIGTVDLGDRRRNYVGERDSRLHIPVSGSLNSGFVNIYAFRDNSSDVFQTRTIELETPESNIVIYEKLDVSAD